MKIKAPEQGVYHNVPPEIYHRWDAISSTLLKKYEKNPATARLPFMPSDDVNVGSGIHAYVLQGVAGLNNECFILPMDCEGTSKAAKESRQVCLSMNYGKTPLPPRYGVGAAENKVPMMDVLTGVNTSFRSHPKTSTILALAGKRVEVSLVWTDIQSGCACKARLDVWDGQIIWDIKKTRDLDRFQWQIKELNYEIQAGFYFEGAIQCGLNPVAFGFLPCEAVEPYRVGCGYLDPDKLEAARVNSLRLVGLVKESHETGNWPNYKPPVHITSWAQINPDDLVEVY
jgi:hypothetical protein